MDRAATNHCRFCAEPRDADKLLNLKMDVEKYQATLSKLTFLKATYIDISESTLPQTICFICYDSLSQAYDFLNKVKRAQDVISSLYLGNKSASFDQAGDDKISFDDLINDDAETNIKQETSGVKCQRNCSNTEAKVQVKIEPKEELDAYDSEDDTSSMGHSPSPSNYDDSLNVQDIIDAVSGTPYTSNVAIYAKEMSSISKKVINTWQDYPWLCAHCNIEFQDIATLRKHSKLVHQKCSAFKCMDCNTYRYKTFRAFIRHVTKHRECLLNVCYYCEATPSDLRPHLATHLESHHACPACGDILNNPESLQQHILDYNTGKPKRKPRRKRGVPITIADLTCTICQKVYKNPNSLRDHIKHIHRSDRKRDYTCERCGKTFFNKGTLTSHISSHDHIRPYICRICNKSFLFPNMLRRHVQMHSGIKPFSCEQCGKCFRLQYQLNTHKIVHTDAMPYICQYCNKTFRFKQILQNHERQHTGAKPYSCNQCGMEFTNWSNYNKHMKRRHGTDTSKKKITPDGVFPINPETGQIVQVQDAGLDEWKSRVMIPVKRGKKKIIKKEKNDEIVTPAEFDNRASDSERDDKFSNTQFQNADELVS